MRLVPISRAVQRPKAPLRFSGRLYATLDASASRATAGTKLIGENRLIKALKRTSNRLEIAVRPLMTAFLTASISIVTDTRPPAITGCGVCLESHEKTLIGTGIGREAVHEALRIAAVVHAAAVTLDAEAALTV